MVTTEPRIRLSLSEDITMDIRNVKFRWFVFFVLGLLLCGSVFVMVVVVRSPRKIHQSQREQWLRKAVGEVLFLDVSFRVQQIMKTEEVDDKKLSCLFNTLVQHQTPKGGDKELDLFFNPIHEMWAEAWSNYLSGAWGHYSDRTAFYLQTNPDFGNRWYAMNYSGEWRTASVENVRANLSSNFIRHVFYYDGDFPSWKVSASPSGASDTSLSNVVFETVD